jgi:hypothetical protein
MRNQEGDMIKQLRQLVNNIEGRPKKIINGSPDASFS